MKTIYFVRHGESVANTEPFFHGEVGPLTNRGREEAQLIAQRCSRLTVEALIASTMERTRETASFIADRVRKPIEYSDEFVERRRPKSLVGRSEADADAKSLDEKWTESLFTEGSRVEDGENFTDIKSRAQRAYAFLGKRAESHILVVTHGFFLRMLAAYVIFGDSMTGEEFKKIIMSFRTDTSGLTIVQSAPKDMWHPWMGKRTWILRAWNDHAHLG